MRRNWRRRGGSWRRAGRREWWSRGRKVAFCDEIRHAPEVQKCIKWRSEAVVVVHSEVDLEELLVDELDSERMPLLLVTQSDRVIWVAETANT